MKKTLVIAIAFLAVVLVAGAVYAAQSAAPVAEPVAATVAAPAASTPAPIAPEGLEGMIFAPVEAGVCCKAECFEAFTACREACAGDFACNEQCQQAKEACLSNC